MNFQERISVRVRDARSQTIGRVASAVGGTVNQDALDGTSLAINNVSIQPLFWR